MKTLLWIVVGPLSLANCAFSSALKTVENSQFSEASTDFFSQPKARHSPSESQKEDAFSLYSSDDKGPIDPDESTGFSDAETLTFNTYYSRKFQYAGDQDFFTCSFSANQTTLFFFSSITIKLSVWRLGDGGIWSVYYPQTTFPTEKYFYPEAGTYCFVFTDTTAGNYMFACLGATMPTSNIDSYFIRERFTSSGHTVLSIVQEDYSSAPTSGTKSGLVSSENGVNLPTSLTGSGYVRSQISSGIYYYGAEIKEFPPLDGIYDNNGNPASSTNDDDRMFLSAQASYPASAVVQTLANFDGNSNNLARGSGFFVDNEYIFTAGHGLYNYKNGLFLKGMTVRVGTQSTHRYTDTALTGYFPYRYYLYHERAYDWAILRVANSSSPSNYNHGYLGLSYNTSTNSTNNSVLGFPAYYNTDSPSNKGLPDEREEDRNPGSYKNVVSSGTLYSYNGAFRCHVDFTAGQSGAPSVIADSGSYYAQGIVSGSQNDQSGSYNYLSAVNPSNFSLLNDLLNGVVL